MASGQIEDRWLNKRKDPVTGKRARTARYGKGQRYRVKGIPGVRDRSFDTLDEAKRWQAKASADTERGMFYDPRHGNVTLREYVEQTWWPGLRVSPTSRETMRSRVFKHILPHVGELRLNQIGPDEIRLWLAAAEKSIDVNTAITTWRHFSAIMQAAYKSRPPKIPSNPFRDEDLSPPSRPPSKAKAWDEERLYAVRQALDARYRMLPDLGAGAGLRQGEAFGFSPDDIVGDEIHVARQVVRINSRLAFAPPKGNKTRTTPCAPALRQAIKAHQKEFPTVEVTLPWVDPDRPHLAWEDRPLVTVRLLTTTPRTSGISGGAINRVTFDEKQWKPALVRAGVLPAPKKEVVHTGAGRSYTRRIYNMPREEGFHVTRHTFASAVLAAGETITQLAAWLGHSDPAFTLRTYVHFMPKSGSRGIEAIGEMLARRPGAPTVSAARKSPESPQAPLQPPVEA